MKTKTSIYCLKVLGSESKEVAKSVSYIELFSGIRNYPPPHPLLFFYFYAEHAAGSRCKLLVLGLWVALPDVTYVTSFFPGSTRVI